MLCCWYVQSAVDTLPVGFQLLLPFQSTCNLTNRAFVSFKRRICAMLSAFCLLSNLILCERCCGRHLQPFLHAACTPVAAPCSTAWRLCAAFDGA